MTCLRIVLAITLQPLAGCHSAKTPENANCCAAAVQGCFFLSGLHPPILGFSRLCITFGVRLRSELAVMGDL
jgi:hypothetical protein